MAWWKRLKKSTPEEEQAFQDMLEGEKVTGKEKFSMVLAAFLVIWLPCTLILVGIALVAMLLLGVL